MPSKGYGTIGLKPAILSKLQKATDDYYPGMFLPSALIILMNEIKRENYSVEMHNMKVDFSGTYTSLTIRHDVKEWLEENYVNLKEEYYQKYKINNFTKFASIFTLNMFESKAKAQNYIVKLNESNFRWLLDEYKTQQKEYDTKYETQTFEQFADKFLKELFEKLHVSKIINS